MQTFLPYSDFKKCAECLDDKRLFKQIVECKQILKAIKANELKIKCGWQHHPVVKMWQRYPEALKTYQFYCIREWCRRRFDIHINNADGISYNIPDWMNSNGLHEAYRSNLLRKNIAHYSQFGWKELDNLQYIYPEVK